MSPPNVYYMSTPSDSGLDMEALELQLLPAWARQTTAPNRYADFEGDRSDAGGRRRDHRGPPGRRPDRGPSRSSDDRSRPPRREGGPRPGGPRRDNRSAPPPAPVLPDLNVNLIPEPKGVESLARQIRLTGRAYPIFEIAQLILRKPDRYQIRFNVNRKPDGEVAQALWLCNLDDSAWLSEPDAVAHVLRHHFDTFYQTEKTPTDPPKGTYTFVAQCGLSGTILGPPNFHDYQTKLARLHTARYSRMPFEAFKSRVRIVRDEAVVKKWIEEQSFKISYVCLNVPEALTLPSMAEVETHFRQVHLSNIIRTVEDWTVDGATAQRLPAIELRQLARRIWDEQHRFPLKLVGVLSQQFASHGLQFFKVNKTVTHVSVARPHHLDIETTPVSDGIRQIVEHINDHPGCTRRLLLDALAPKPATPPATPVAPPTEVEVAPTPAPPTVEPAAQEPTATESETTAPAPAPDTTTTEQPQPAAPVVEKAPESAPAQPELTPQQTAVTADLHWLIHQGHVIEFATGKLETAKKPKPKPAPLPRPVVEHKPETQPAVHAESEPTTGSGPGATPTVDAEPSETVAGQPTVNPPSESVIDGTVSPPSPDLPADPEEPLSTPTTPGPEPKPEPDPPSPGLAAADPSVSHDPSPLTPPEMIPEAPTRSEPDQPEEPEDPNATKQT